MYWFLKVIRQYADFNGRARRKEYWMFMLFNLLFTFAIPYIGGYICSLLRIHTYNPIYLIVALYVFALTIPQFAVSIRRLHDIGKSGYMVFITFIPFIGSLWLIILMLKEGNPGPNKYGPDPKAVSNMSYIK